MPNQEIRRGRTPAGQRNAAIEHRDLVNIDLSGLFVVRVKREARSFLTAIKPNVRSRPSAPNAHQKSLYSQCSEPLCQTLPHQAHQT